METDGESRNTKKDWVVVSNIFYFHPYLGKITILTNIFQMGWFNHQPEDEGFYSSKFLKKVRSLEKDFVPRASVFDA